MDNTYLSYSYKIFKEPSPKQLDYIYTITEGDVLVCWSRNKKSGKGILEILSDIPLTKKKRSQLNKIFNVKGEEVIKFYSL